MKYSNPQIPEGINVSPDNPVKEFLTLSTGIIAIVILIVFLIGTLLDWSSQYIPFEYEQQLAQPIVVKYLDEYAASSVTDKDNEIVDISRYLQEKADSITALMTLPPGIEVTLHYINDSTVNGMATLGGHIFIFRGLLEKLASENALTMLLAHEISHVTLRHPVKALSKGVLINLLAAVVSGQSHADVSGVVSGTSQLAFLGFSRSQEQEADKIAIELNYKYYHHTQGATELFDVLWQESQKKEIEAIGLFSSHPELSGRMSYVAEMSDKNNWHIYGQTIEIPSEIVAQMQRDKQSSL